MMLGQVIESYVESWKVQPLRFPAMFELATGRWGMILDPTCPAVDGKVSLFKTLSPTEVVTAMP